MFLRALLDRERAADLAEHGHLLGLARLEQLFDTRQTLRDVVAGDAAGVEGTHGQLRAGLADGLRGDDADGFAGVDRLAGGQVRCRSSWRTRRSAASQVRTLRTCNARQCRAAASTFASPVMSI